MLQRDEPEQAEKSTIQGKHQQSWKTPSSVERENFHSERHGHPQKRRDQSAQQQ